MIKYRSFVFRKTNNTVGGNFLNMFGQGQDGGASLWLPRSTTAVPGTQENCVINHSFIQNVHLVDDINDWVAMQKKYIQTCRLFYLAIIFRIPFILYDMELV